MRVTGMKNEKKLESEGFVKIAEKPEAGITFYTNSRICPEEIENQKIIAVFNNGKTSYITVYALIREIVDYIYGAKYNGGIIALKDKIIIKTRSGSMVLYR